MCPSDLCQFAGRAVPQGVTTFGHLSWYYYHHKNTIILTRTSPQRRCHLFRRPHEYDNPDGTPVSSLAWQDHLPYRSKPHAWTPFAMRIRT